MTPQAITVLLDHPDPNHVAYRWRDQEYSVAWVQAHTRSTRHALVTQDIRPGHTVILRASDSMQWICVFWALAMIGCRTIIVLDNIDDATWLQISTQYRADFLITDRDTHDAHLPRIDINSLDTGDRFPGVEEPVYRYHIHEPLFYWASSGTNGGFKLIAHTNSSFLATQLGLHHYWNMVGGSRGDVVFCPSRMAFSMGCCFNVLGPLTLNYQALVGKTFVELRDIKTFVQHNRVSHLMVTPYVLDFVERISTAATLDTIKSVTSSAESLPLDLAQRFHSKFGIPVFNLYGSSELLIVAMSRDLPKENSVGQVLPHVQVRLVDDQGTDSGCGVIQVRSPSQFTAYLDDDNTTAMVLQQGWVHTNDIGYFDEDNNLILLGRANACVKVRGQWISLASVENKLMTLPGVQDCVVLPTKNPRGLLELMALIVSQSQVLGVRSVLDRSKISVLTQIHMVPDIPRTANMKKIRNLDIIQQKLNIALT
jgi:acyl-coenzyme A synthetase/AMP-(fatty) acid ligase